ncbi:MAG: hypothetical protein ACREPV_01750 [Lysobacter sp.]
MNTRNRNLLVVALATALAAPIAAATGLDGAAPLATAQSETTQGELDEAEATEALPPQVNPPETGEQELDPRAPPVEDVEDPMSTVPPPPPMQSQDAMPPADPANVARDPRWVELDANGDGRIDAQEGAADADFNASFAMMDGDGDGFVTEAEFRAHGQGDDGMKHDGMRHDMDRDDHKDDMKDIDDDAMDNTMDATDPVDDATDDGIDDPVDG